MAGGAALLEAIRKREGIQTKAAMARRLGISAPYYTEITTGKYEISRGVARRVHRVFGVPYDVIFAEPKDATGTDGC